MLRAFLLVLLVAPVAHAQIWNNQPLEQGFERADFFFRPTFINPYGLGNFGSVAPGLIDSPLLDLQVNPARLADYSEGQLYLDFRGTHEGRDRAIYPYLRYADNAARLASDVAYYPGYYAQGSRPVDPVLSTAVITRPFGKGRPVWLGGSVQGIFRDGAYHYVPYGDYRTELGADFAGNRADSESIPITDRLNGTDQMREAGAFITVFGGARLLPNVDLGIRLARNVFDRDGDLANLNRYDAAVSSGQTSFWSHDERRAQDYDAWDASAGLRIQLNRRLSVGVTAGYLTGGASQRQTRQDSSFSVYDRPTDSYASRYFNDGGADQRWDHDGETLYGGLQSTIDFKKGQRLQLTYRFLQERTDLGLASVAQDTSYSFYRSAYENRRYQGEWASGFSDTRTGAGNREVDLHRLGVAYRWILDRKTQLDLGAQIQRTDRRTTTSEAVTGRRAWENEYINNGTAEARSEDIRETKTLNWTFDARTTTVFVPAYVTRKINGAFEVTFGIARSLSAWRIEDETLALIDERVNTTNGETVRETDFGERFRVPTERQSEVETSLLFGATVRPAKDLSLRLSFSPTRRSSYYAGDLTDFEGWLALELNF